MRTCQCPNCGAQFTIENGRDFAFCQYCGTKIMLDDYRSTHRVIDEARIQETETERIIRLRELELEEKEKDRNRKGIFIAFGIAFALIFAGATFDIFRPYNIFIIIAGIWLAITTFNNTASQKKKREDARNARSGMIKLTSVATIYKDKNYRILEATYTQLGFKNVSVINMRDLRVGLLTKPGTIETVTIDGKEPVEGKWYHPHAAIVISYHGIAD